MMAVIGLWTVYALLQCPRLRAETRVNREEGLCLGRLKTVAKTMIPHGTKLLCLLLPVRGVEVSTRRSNARSRLMAAALCQRYEELNWKVEVLPWMVDVRGVVDTAELHHALELVDTPVQRRQRLLRSTAAVLVESFVFLQRARQPTNLKRINLNGGCGTSAGKGGC